MLASNIGKLSGQLAEADFKKMINDLSTTIQRTGSMVNNVNRTLIKNQDNIQETMENLRDASSNLNDFSRQIADNPAIMLRGN